MSEATTQDTALKLIERLLDENKALQAENERLRAMPYFVLPERVYTPPIPWTWPPWDSPFCFTATFP